MEVEESETRETIANTEEASEANNVNGGATKSKPIPSEATNGNSSSGNANGAETEILDNNNIDEESTKAAPISIKKSANGPPTVRVVPIERLLATPHKSHQKQPTPTKASLKQAQTPKKAKTGIVLPPRQSRNKNASIIELSDSSSSSSSGVEEVESQQVVRKTSTRKTNRKLVSSSSEDEAVQEVQRRNQKKPQRSNCSSTNSSRSNSRSSSSKINHKKDAKNRNSEKLSSNGSSFLLKRCVVRVKRIKLPEQVTAKAAKAEATTAYTKSNKRRKMSSSSSSSDEAGEQATTSSSAAKRRRRNQSDNEDSDWGAAMQMDAVSEKEEEEEEEDELVEEAAAEVEEEDAKSSDSEVMPQRRKRNFKGSGGSKAAEAAAAASDSNDSSDFEPEEKKKKDKKKRRRIRKASSGDSDGDDEKNKNKRKEIRKIMKTKDLDVSTKEAGKEEEERRKRIEERQKLYNRIFDKSKSVEINELVLDFDEDSKKALLQVDKGLLKKLKPHQVTGVKFMWDACFETLKDTEEKPGSGCILAHCMGLGKTLQVVALTHTLLANTRRTGIERVLIITPLSTVNNWAREFVMWMKFANKRDIEVYDISRYKDKPTRIFKLNEWFEEGGVCILGYDMYRILANEKAKGLRKKQREQLQQALVEPGPDLVVCDEGHLLKNEKTSISKAVTRMRTKRRIVLTGTPLQNNLKEYYCMIQFVKPNLLGTYKEYMNRFVNPISNGQYSDSTDRDLRLMKHRSHILHKLLEGCIQRRDYSVLAPYLPPKHEYVVYTTLSELQQKLYGYYMTTYRETQNSLDLGGKGARLFQDFQDLRRIWTHPMNLRVNSDIVIAKRLLSNDDSDMEGFICDETDEDEEVVSNSSESCESFKSDASMNLGTRGAGAQLKKRKTRNGVRTGAVEDSDSEPEIVGVSSATAAPDDPSEWWKQFVEDKELNNINHSPKLMILMRLLQECEAIGDKLLVFSQSLQSIDVIEHFLNLVHLNTKNEEFEGDVGSFKGLWTPGVDYFRLDGSCSVEQREAMCKKFNDAANLRARLFLISTRAGGLGINLVAANRVVIFDVSWNPSHDTQSIFRVYRFGQIKPCYIYRLIAMGTMEQKVYERQVAKQATAKRVIDEQQISRHYNQTDLMELYTYELTPSAEREMPILPKDRLFAELLTEMEKLIFKYHEHDSLLEQEEHENLTEEERKSAWDEYEAEKTRTVQTAQYMSYDRNSFGNQVVANVTSQYGNASGSVTSNRIFGFRSDILLQLLNMKITQDHPELTQNQVIQLVPSYLQQLYTEMNDGNATMYKVLLQLHSTIVHPSGMYMNPLLYANQNPAAAGYQQATTAKPNQVEPGTSAGPAKPAPGFEADKVYEID